MRYAFVIFIIFTFPILASAVTLKVPSQYPIIQDAINAASGGDTVKVAPGTYVENIDFKGKAITVKSSGGAGMTVIDGNEAGSVVTFNSGEGSSSVLNGFTLTNGSGTYFEYYPGKWTFCGGGIFCYCSSPTITNNTITGNYADAYGGGIYCDISSPTITNNTISRNYMDGIFCINKSFPTITYNTISRNGTYFTGGGISCYQSSPSIIKNTITGNTARHGGGICCDFSSPIITNNNISGNTAQYGGGIFCCHSSPTITNNTISGNTANYYDHRGSGGGICCSYYSSSIIINNTIIGNTAEDFGGGIYFCISSSSSIINTILWNNNASFGPEIWIGDTKYPSTLTISHSVVKGWKPSVNVEPGCTLNWGAGMIAKDPLFTAGPHGFLYLSQKAAGQPVDSPCLNTGSGIASNLGMHIYWTRMDGVPDTGFVDMGFHYGNFTFPALQTDVFSIPQGASGDADFIMLAGTGNAYRNYILLGSVSGTNYGTLLPGNKVTLPLKWDFFTNLIINNINTPTFSNFMGTLDGTGSAMAMFDTLQPVPGMAGTTLHFAFALNNPWDFVSNPVGIVVQ